MPELRSALTANGNNLVHWNVVYAPGGDDAVALADGFWGNTLAFTVPEPASLMLLGAAVAAIVTQRRRTAR
jgi:hypothetical protein